MFNLSPCFDIIESCFLIKMIQINLLTLSSVICNLFFKHSDCAYEYSEVDITIFSVSVNICIVSRKQVFQKNVLIFLLVLIVPYSQQNYFVFIQSRIYSKIACEKINHSQWHSTQYSGILMMYYQLVDFTFIRTDFDGNQN